MKLRINGSSIRLRLSQGEVSSCSNHLQVTDTIQLPNGRSFQYQILGSSGDVFEVQWADQLRVLVPSKILSTWSTSDNIGIYEDLPLKDGGTLKLTIEKDFRCLQDRPHENEEDLFPNPKAGHG